MIKIFPDNTASREPLPKFLRGLKSESLSDLSWTDPALGVQDFAWWPEQTVIPEFNTKTHILDGTESFEILEGNQVVLVTKGVRALTPEEIENKIAEHKAKNKSTAQEKQEKIILEFSKNETRKELGLPPLIANED